LKAEDIKVCVLRVGGTNCDFETQRAFQEFGCQAETLLLNDLVRRKNLMEYQILVIPGGFSYGDYVRSGVIFARTISARLQEEFKAFVEENRPILGVCNGFQVLVEEGLLPGFEGTSVYPEATLANNVAGFQCRWVYLRQENEGKCIFTSKIPKGKILHIPIAHGEGRFLFPKEKEEKLLNTLYENDMMVFRYCQKNGDFAQGRFPANPNGSLDDIAGICNKEGTIFGLMPHPERAVYAWQHPGWTADKQIERYGDGKLIFESVIDDLIKKV
jgi:phosphoribosylformylglycinamidine synthase I